MTQHEEIALYASQALNAYIVRGFEMATAIDLAKEAAILMHARIIQAFDEDEII